MKKTMSRAEKFIFLSQVLQCFRKASAWQAPSSTPEAKLEHFAKKGVLVADKYSLHGLFSAPQRLAQWLGYVIHIQLRWSKSWCDV